MIVYVGHYVPKSVKVERGLPSWNIAASNRMHRLGNALRTTGKRLCIVSPCSAMRIRKRGYVKYPHRVLREHGIPVICCATLGIPYTSLFTDLITVPSCIIALAKKHKLSGIMIYNYSIASLAAAVIGKLLLQVPVVMNMEDVASFPKRGDAIPMSLSEALQQCMLHMTRKVTARIVNAIVIPSKRFMPFVPPDKIVNVITGCFSIKPVNMKRTFFADKNLRVLFCGKLEREHGIELLLEAARLLDSWGDHRYTFDICGDGSKVHDARKMSEMLTSVKLNVHGYVDDDAYKTILSKADICFALQDPHGRNANFKTPSKGYEAMASGKALIVSDIGDYSSLPSNVCYVIKDYSGLALAHLLNRLTETDIFQTCSNAYDYAWKHWRAEHVGKELVALFKHV